MQRRCRPSRSSRSSATSLRPIWRTDRSRGARNWSMPDLVKFTVDGQELQAAPGTLVINAAKQAGIEIPAFCYYDGYSLQAACRMCLVEVEKAPKMQTACTLPVAEGMIVRSATPQIATARKMTLEYLLTN